MGYKFEALNSNNEVIYEESYGFLMFAIGGGIQPGGTYEFSVEIKDDAAVLYIKSIGVSYNNVKISYSSVNYQE